MFRRLCQRSLLIEVSLFFLDSSVAPLLTLFPHVTADSDVQQSEEWPPLPAPVVNAPVARDRRKSLPLPGGISPADMDELHDLTLRRMPLHERRTSDLLNTDRTDAIPRAPTPVPASLAPAQGHMTPKILKRPVSHSISLRPESSRGFLRNAPSAVLEDTTRTRSTTQSSMDRSDPACAANYAYGAAQQIEGVTNVEQNSTEDEYGPITPAQGSSNAFPRVMQDYATNATVGAFEEIESLAR